MIDDDASPEELARWYRRTPDEIEAERRARWNDQWNALRTPEAQAREPDTLFGGGGDDRIEGGAGPDSLSAPAPTLKVLKPSTEGFIDALGSGEAPDYDMYHRMPGHPQHRLPRLPNGQPDYSRHPGFTRFGPGDATGIVGRFQIRGDTWAENAKRHPDLVGYAPQTQRVGAYYIAADAYRRRTGRDLESDLDDARNLPAIFEALKGIWPSLPGGSQQQQTAEQFQARMAATEAQHTRQTRP
jgi:hypothetical protein